MTEMNRESDQKAGIMDWPGEKVVIRLLETLEKGVGGFLRPWQERRVGKSNAEVRAMERLVLEQTEEDIKSIKAGKKRLGKNGTLVAVKAPEASKLITTIGNQGIEEKSETVSLFDQKLFPISQEISYTHEMQRAVNLKRIALYAEEEAEEIDKKNSNAKNENANQEEVDVDWFARWRNASQDVSREELQQVWGKILAGEVANPGAYSLRTIDFFSKLNTRDAKKITHLAQFFTEMGVIRIEGFFDQNGITYSDFLFFQEIGLLFGVTGGKAAGVSYKKDMALNGHGEHYTHFDYNQTPIYISWGKIPENDASTKFSVFGMTQTAKEIAPLIVVQSNQAYVSEIAKMALKQGAISVSLGEYDDDGESFRIVREIMRSETK